MDEFRDHKNFIYGIRAVIEALKAGQEVEVVYVRQNTHGPLMTELRNELKTRAVPSKQLPALAFNKFRDQNHQGIVAALSPITYTMLEWLVPSLYEQGKSPFFLILDKVTDVRNFGAICRSASCFGVDAVIIPAKGSAMINEFAVKSSAGALLHLSVCRVKSLVNTLEFLKESGITILACSEKGDRDYTSVSYNEPLAIVMGAEDLGISRSIMDVCDAAIKIPMQGPIESLNVSVAAGIILSNAFNTRYRDEV
ncbi:MAG TPA: 23S rRNA (guanosine(2251)-2'-O)-methyltransferase RlmB [Flavobacteriales bacterium]|nr:23S rRNA (guanosine(2251)-2'-O)-methyltransferase RlmB [Flavobacteriales bacterium]